MKYNFTLDVSSKDIPYIKNLKSSEVGSSFLRTGDIVMADTAEDEAVGKAIEIINEDNVNIVAGLHTYAFRPKDKKGLNYLGYYINSNFYHNQLGSIMQGIKVLSLSKTNLSKTIIKSPTQIQEQEKIGKYFETLDSSITLYQRKLEKLKLFKKACLEKMFPRNNEDYPEIRFKGFTNAWKKYRVEEVAERYDNLRIPISENKRIPGITPYFGANGIQDYVEGFTHDGEYILIAEDGANDLKNYPVQYVNGKIWVNNHAHVLSGKKALADTLFMRYAFSQLNIEQFLVGGGRAKLNSSVMMTIEIILSGIKEQEKIGEYFKTLDKAINLYERKLEKLKIMKKSCLEKMFV